MGTVLVLGMSPRALLCLHIFTIFSVLSLSLPFRVSTSVHLSFFIFFLSSFHTLLCTTKAFHTIAVVAPSLKSSVRMVLADEVRDITVACAVWWVWFVC